MLDGRQQYPDRSQYTGITGMTLERRNLFEAMNDSKKQSFLYCDKMAAAQWFVFSEANRAANCILSKTIQLLTSPHGFLAGLYDVDLIPVDRVVGPFDYACDDDEGIP